MAMDFNAHSVLFNRYKELVNTSRYAVSKHIRYLLKPEYPKGSDEKLNELIDIWDADCRAMDAALNVKRHYNKTLPVMPPDDEEHQLCRKMAAIQIEGLMYGEQSAQHYLYSVIEEILNKRKLAYHPPTCACQIFDLWTNENAVKVQRLKDFYERVANGCQGGADSPPPADYRAYLNPLIADSP